MRMFTIESEIWLREPLEVVFPFFANAHNLGLLTPPWLRFEVLTPGEISIQPGARIDYRLRLRGLPIRWQSEITVFEPPFRFVDEQRRGPYRRWVHHHEFAERDGSTLTSDRVAYSVWGGALVNRLFVAPDLRRVFAYRRQKLKELFGERSLGEL